MGRGVTVLHFHSGRSDASNSVKHLIRFVGPRIPFILSLHGPSVWEPRLNEEKWRRRHQQNAAGASAIVVPSEFERSVQIKCGIEPEQVFVVPDIVEGRVTSPGLLREELGFEAERPLVVFCGRLVPEKGVLTLLSAFRCVHEKFPEVALIIAGAGPLIDSCRKFARELGNAVQVLGHRNDVGPVYSDADVFVAPSTGESFGISAIEAALSNVPMVLSRIAPWTDVFKEDRDCEYVEIGNYEQIAEAISRLIVDRERAKRMAVSARKVAKSRFSEQATVTALNRIYAYLNII
jgi:glycosyltransferase involved in cell wall biosynthesis